MDVKKIVDGLHKTFLSGKTRPATWRKKQLELIITMLQENRDSIKSALESDLGHKNSFFPDVIEIQGIITEANIAIKSIDEWMKDRSVSTPMLMQPASSFIRPEPKGVVTIIAPWNYPIQLALIPLIGSISAGNCSVIKPSEVTPKCSSVLKQLIEKYLDKEAFAVIEGGIPETTELLKQKVDHIFYTGNGTVGKIVMKAAAEHLSGVTLELGGKSPAIVAKDCDVEVTAKRILWGKFMNCGQTCVAPDYILVEKQVKDKLVGALLKNLKEFYSENPKESQDYSRIVNSRHTERIGKTIEATIKNGAKLEVGGEVDKDNCYIAPTLFTNVSLTSPIMDEENFGPILPIIEIEDIDETINFINSKDHPLALYVFSSSTKTRDYVFNNTRAGGSCFNDCVVHVGNPHLPFGGTGPSGVGSYHGQYGFDNLSHFRSILTKGTAIDLSVRYPPYTTSKLSQISFLNNLKISPTLLMSVAFVGVGIGTYTFISMGGNEIMRNALVGGLTWTLDYLKK